MPAEPSPRPALARALADQAQAQVTDLRKARGLGAETFASLARRAGDLVERLAGAPDDLLAPLRESRAVLRAVARLIDDPQAAEIPPSNDAVYAAVLDVTELEAVVASLGSRRAPRLLAHLSEADTGRARRDRLTLGFAAVCRRAGLTVRLADESGAPAQLELGRWPVAAAAGVPLSRDELIPAARAAEQALRDAGRPGLLVLECAPLLAWTPIRVADDHTAVSVMNERLDAFMIDARDEIADATGTDHAFGLVVHATLPATNVASRRLLFAECLRAVNLCDADDPRIGGFQAFIDAISRAERRPPA